MKRLVEYRVLPAESGDRFELSSRTVSDHRSVAAWLVQLRADGYVCRMRSDVLALTNTNGCDADGEPFVICQISPGWFLAARIEEVQQ